MSNSVTVCLSLVFVYWIGVVPWVSGKVMYASVPVPDDQFECLHFDHTQQPASAEQRGAWLYGSKTTYLRAREAIQANQSTAWPFDPTKCQSVYLYYLGRHTIRYGEASDARRWVQQMPAEVTTVLANAKHLDPRLADRLSRWRSPFRAFQDKHISESGVWQSATTARIFRDLYPDLLNTTTGAKFEVKVSLKVRTTETADAFIRSLLAMQSDTESSNWTATQVNIETALDRQFRPYNRTMMLQTHSYCESANTQPQWPPRQSMQLRNTTAMRQMVRHFMQRNGLADPKTANHIADWKRMESMQKLCQYETAIYGQSVWCELFTVNEWKALQYFNDFQSYLESYDEEVYRKQACVVILDLYRHLKSIVDQDSRGESHSQPNSLYFSHDTMLRRLYAFLGVLNETPPWYRLDEDGRLCVPRHYQFRNALLVPFGANMALSLHRCQGRLRMLTTVNEVPMQLVPNCPNGFCDVQVFLDHFHNIQNECNIDKLCPY